MPNNNDVKSQKLEEAKNHFQSPEIPIIKLPLFTVSLVLQESKKKIFWLMIFMLPFIFGNLALLASDIFKFPDSLLIIILLAFFLLSDIFLGIKLVKPPNSIGFIQNGILINVLNIKTLFKSASFLFPWEIIQSLRFEKVDVSTILGSVYYNGALMIRIKDKVDKTTLLSQITNQKLHKVIYPYNGEQSSFVNLRQLYNRSLPIVGFVVVLDYIVPNVQTDNFTRQAIGVISSQTSQC